MNIDKAIKIRCGGEIHLNLSELNFFQNKLKTIDKDQFRMLKESIIKDGIPIGFHIWFDEKKKSWQILDGHHRYLVLVELEKEGWFIPSLPCNKVIAKTRKEAAAIVLIASSRYARMNAESVGNFMIDFELQLPDIELLDLIDVDMGQFGLEHNDGDKGDNYGNMRDIFLYPPFSIINAREGEWQERKKYWMAMGISSEIGRDIKPTSVSENCPAYMADRGNNEGGSIFDPALTELLYTWFSPKGCTILDPFAGGSVRGIVASKLKRNYIGIDLRKEQIDANIEQAKIICNDFTPQWICEDSLNIKDVVNVKADLIFTCPPYADLEVYSNDLRDISNKKYGDFITLYRQIIKNTVDLLNNDRFICIIVGEVRDKKTGIYYEFVPDTIEAFKDAGCFYYNELILITCVGSLPLRAGKAFKASRKIGKTHQNILVFCKGNPKKASEYCGDIQIKEILADTTD